VGRTCGHKYHMFSEIPGNTDRIPFEICQMNWQIHPKFTK
jgi:hypothetical protein